MAHTIERDCFVLKVRDERALQLEVGRVLQVEIERLDDDRARRTFRGCVVVGDVDLGVTATAEPLDDVVAPSSLLCCNFSSDILISHKKAQKSQND
jgi:hypothetical protein